MKPRYYKVTTEHVMAALEVYLKSLSVMNDDDIITDFEEQFDGLTVRIRKED